ARIRRADAAERAGRVLRARLHRGGAGAPAVWPRAADPEPPRRDPPCADRQCRELRPHLGDKAAPLSDRRPRPAARRGRGVAGAAPPRCAPPPPPPPAPGGAPPPPPPPPAGPGGRPPRGRGRTPPAHASSRPLVRPR